MHKQKHKHTNIKELYNMDVRKRMLPSHVVLCSHQNLAEDANYQLRLADETQPSPSSNFTSSSTLQRLISPWLSSTTKAYTLFLQLVSCDLLSLVGETAVPFNCSIFLVLLELATR